MGVAYNAVQPAVVAKTERRGKWFKPLIAFQLERSNKYLMVYLNLNCPKGQCHLSVVLIYPTCRRE
jgi:hypothetical protein